LREIGEARGRQEKLLVFTQFKEIIPPLESCSRARSGAAAGFFMVRRQ